MRVLKILLNRSYTCYDISEWVCMVFFISFGLWRKFSVIISYHVYNRNAVPLRKGFEIPSLGSERPLSVSVPAQRGGRVLGQGTQPEALQKISALEEELLKLRAQIAMIVTAPAGNTCYEVLTDWLKFCKSKDLIKWKGCLWGQPIIFSLTLRFTEICVFKKYNLLNIV